ncbi:uroporphyrinogen-III synthase [Cognatilysobacter tabacisoli]|uniref:uroporphyrinogen-III synthase n=1 Tax=Cognatilysobacter tabacisoli TaxID=2315424 RepID=UPI000E6AF8DC|nr:uroporphyrinogen-III synthase [Lysobacter tabacisoli]
MTASTTTAANDGPRTAPGWYVISLRPRGDHDAMRRAAARAGAGLIALSPWRIDARDDGATRDALARALSAPVIVVTSPAAVRAAARLAALGEVRATWLAVGRTTAAALRRAGVVDVTSPARMDSEGLLALPALQAVDGVDVALVTAPGGRGELAPALTARGARVRRADVYQRTPTPPPPRALAALRALDAPAVLAVSSGEALQRTLAGVPANVAAILRAQRVAVASARLGELARASGFTRIVVADGPRPRDLVAAAARSLR